MIIWPHFVWKTAGIGEMGRGGPWGFLPCSVTKKDATLLLHERVDTDVAQLI